MSTLPPAVPPSLPKKRRSGNVRLLMGVTLCAIALPLIIPCLYLLEKSRGRAAWRAYETAAKARGVKLDVADFIPPQIPDAENFASIPIFDAAFRASDEKQVVPDPFKLPSTGYEMFPKFAAPVKQEPIDLAAWQKYFVETKLLPATGESAAADVLKALEKFADPFAQIRKAGARPHRRFPVHWEQGFAAKYPHLELVSNASKLLALRLAANLALGKSAAAYEDFRDGLRFSTATRQEPLVLSGLVRISAVAKMENAVWDGLARHQWAEPELRMIETDLANFDWLKDYVFAMASERVGFNAMTDMVIEHPQQFVDAALGGDSRTSGGLRLYPSGWLYQSKVRANHLFDELLARIDPGQRRFFGERPVPSSPAQMTSLVTCVYYAHFRILTSAYESVEKRFVQAATLTDHTRLACALERFRLARGTYPEALAELAPEFIPAVPAEIVNGEPYRYRRTEDGSFVLYSVGTDLRDDGGVLNPKASEWKQADWVWRYPAQ